MLAFWRYFNDEIARPAHQVLSVRDLLAWVDFVNARPSGADPLLALAHGAQLVFLDGLGLGVGLSVEVRSHRGWARRAGGLRQLFLERAGPERATCASRVAFLRSVVLCNSPPLSHLSSPTLVL